MCGAFYGQGERGNPSESVPCDLSPMHQVVRGHSIYDFVLSINKFAHYMRWLSSVCALAFDP